MLTSYEKEKERELKNNWCGKIEFKDLLKNTRGRQTFNFLIEVD